MSRMDKLIQSIKASDVDKLTDKAFKECKLESKIDLLGIRLIAHNMLRENTLEEIYDLVGDDEDIVLPELFLPLLPTALKNLGEIVDGTKLTESNYKNILKSLDEQIEK